MSTFFYELEQALRRVCAEEEFGLEELDVVDGLLRVGLVQFSDNVDATVEIVSNEHADGLPGRRVKIRFFHRKTFLKPRAGSPAAERPKPLQEAVGCPVKPRSPEGGEDGAGAPSAARALQGGGRCDCGHSSPCFSSECYHPWRRTMVRLVPWDGVRWVDPVTGGDRLDISQHK